MPGGETCPRCRSRNGYPIPHTILRGGKMVFVCKDCGHRWQKRNLSGIPARWFMYGFGFLIGIGFGLHELFNLLLKDKFIGFMESVKNIFESLLSMIKGIF